MYITGQEEIDALKDLIMERKFFRNKGPGIESQCSRFEKDFSQKIGAEFGLMVTSGTNALFCALRALNIGPGDEVIVPSYTFFATVAAVVNIGATPVIVNIDPLLSLDVEEARSAITSRTRAIIAVHMDGRPCSMDKISSLCAEQGLALIEDVAQAAGGNFQGKRLGSIGQLGCFSFNQDKIISCGEGGAVLTSDRVLYEKCLCTHDASCVFGATFKDEFRSITPFIGQSMRVSEISGALMNVQLARLDGILEDLRARKRIWREIFLSKGLNVIDPHDLEGECATSLYLRFKNIEDTNKIALKLNEHKMTSVPLAVRPAHSAWQWTALLSRANLNRTYKAHEWLTSMDLISTTMKIDVPYNLDLNATEDLALKARALIKT